MNNRSFWLWIAALAVPVVSLIAVQINTNFGASIGGGGYDLGPFLFLAIDHSHSRVVPLRLRPR